MKITEYPSVTSLASDDVMIVDGGEGTRIIPAKDAFMALMDQMSPLNHRMIYRGKNLGTEVTAEQMASVADGSFRGLWLGDFWTIDSIKWRIVDFNYWLNTGDGSTRFASNHLVIMPDTILYTHKMNATATTTGGYTGSMMYTEGLSEARQTITSIFGNYLLSHREYLINTVTGNYPSGGAWYDSDIELPNEPMMFGTHMHTDAGPSVKRYTIDKTQLALMQMCPSFISINSSYWLRDVASETKFANVGYYGSADLNNATVDYGVRPVFAIGLAPN